MTDDADRDGGSSGRSSVPLDETDRRMVELLRADGRLSVPQVAERLHISRAGAYARFERLRSGGVITGFGATVDPQRYGYGVSAYVYLKITQHSWKRVRRQIEGIPQVWHAALVSGDNDLVLLVRTLDAAALRDLVLDSLQSMPDVLSSQTVLIFDETGPPGTATQSS